MPTYLTLTNGFVILFTLIGSFVLTAVARWLAPHLGFVDKPDGTRKLHARAIPLLGGGAVFVAFATAILACRQLWQGIGSRQDNSTQFLTSFLISGGLFCLLGLCDDKWALRPKTKFLGQILACLPYVFFGPQVHSVHFIGFEIHLFSLGILFSIFWFAACTNVINLVDGLDGLASSIGLIASLTVAVMAYFVDRENVAFIAALFAASLAGFLLHNWPPAKIFLGDAGSLTIGFVLGALTLEACLKSATAFALALPLVILSLPAFDTLMAILRRKLNGKSIGDADRGHIHHRLQDRGLTRQQVLLSMIVISLSMSICAIASTYFRAEWIGMLACLIVLSLLVVGRIFGYDETVLFFRHLNAVRTLLENSSGQFRFHIFEARTQSYSEARAQELWGHLCEHIKNFGGTTIVLQVTPAHTTPQVATWNWEWPAGAAHSKGSSQWSFRYCYERTPDEQIVLITSGVNASAKGNSLDALYRSCETLCTKYSLATLLGMVAEQNAQGKLSEQDTPAILAFPATAVSPVVTFANSEHRDRKEVA